MSGNLLFRDRFYFHENLSEAFASPSDLFCNVYIKTFVSSTDRKFTLTKRAHAQ